MGKSISSLKNTFKKYSFDDLAKSLFVLDMWLPNISSPIKLQYLYTLLQTIHNQLSTQSNIKNYADFSELCSQILAEIPSFEMLEDYIPEPDWGEIKFSVGKKNYKIFYGGRLNNTYDFYHSFEFIHYPFDDKYQLIEKKSPIHEMEFCLEFQDHILSNIDQKIHSRVNNINPGHIEIPNKLFWKKAISFLEEFTPNKLYPQYIIDSYSKNLEAEIKQPSMDQFIKSALTGGNCAYFFFQKHNQYYPIMPRMWLMIIYDKWGRLLENILPKLTSLLQKKDVSAFIAFEFAKFMKLRFDKSHFFPFATPLSSNMEVPHELMYSALFKDNTLFLIHITPPIFEETQFTQYYESIYSKLKLSYDLIASQPILGLPVEKKAFSLARDDESNHVQIVIIIGIPNTLTSLEGIAHVPKELFTHIMTLDQLAGILDETNDPVELFEFFRFIENDVIPNPNTYLDKFAAFNKMAGVIIPGAFDPNWLLLDFSSGSFYRFESIKLFWSKFPDTLWYGNPRGWYIPPDTTTNTGFISKARSFFGYAYCQRIGRSFIFINAPLQHMSYDEGMIVDNLMQSLFDSFALYSASLEKLEFIKSPNHLHIYFCPSSIVLDNWNHLSHLIREESLWGIESTQVSYERFAIRLVYTTSNVTAALNEPKDRTFQITLLLAIVDQIGSLSNVPNLGEIKAALAKEKSKKPRFGIFNKDKTVSFPEDIRAIIPDEREYKLADKHIASTALANNVLPGTFSASVAKEKLNSLRTRILQSLNYQILKFAREPLLIELLNRSNALIHDGRRLYEEVQASEDHELDYEPSELVYEKRKSVIKWYRVYRYLIEKVAHLKSDGKALPRENDLKNLLALADRLLDLYTASDFINYELYPVTVEILDDYLVNIKFGNKSIASMELAFGIEQTQLSLGIIGNKDDISDSSLPLEEYLGELDGAFYLDLQFGFRNLLAVQHVLTLWAVYAKVSENGFYSNSTTKILEVCNHAIPDCPSAEITSILNFLILESEDIVKIADDHNTAQDVPVWEHLKRLNRFDIRPIIRIGVHFYWAAYSMERSGKIWANVASIHKLPSKFDFPNVTKVLKKGHKNLEDNLVAKTKEIVLRYTNEVKTDIYPHKYDLTLKDIGDYDVFAYIRKKNILLNIETKIIDSPHSNKDSGRMQRKLFGQSKKQGSQEKGYLQRVEVRANYLQAKGAELMNRIGWDPPISNPKVISVFVTRIGFWWTKHPPLLTDVHFVETRLLDRFIQNLIE